jgi:hypothetical protein
MVWTSQVVAVIGIGYQWGTDIIEITFLGLCVVIVIARGLPSGRVVCEWPLNPRVLHADCSEPAS